MAHGGPRIADQRAFAAGRAPEVRGLRRAAAALVGEAQRRDAGRVEAAAADPFEPPRLADDRRQSRFVGVAGRPPMQLGPSEERAAAQVVDLRERLRDRGRVGRDRLAGRRRVGRRDSVAARRFGRHEPRDGVGRSAVLCAVQRRRSALADGAPARGFARQRWRCTRRRRFKRGLGRHRRVCVARSAIASASSRRPVARDGRHPARQAAHGARTRHARARRRARSATAPCSEARRAASHDGANIDNGDPIGMTTTTHETRNVQGRLA